AQARPRAEFETLLDGQTAQFQNQTTDGLTYQWDFGDGSPLSEEENPSHTYPQDGNYNVTLFAYNQQCASVITREIVILSTFLKEPARSQSWLLYPNPADDQIHLNAFGAGEEWTLKVLDAQGKIWFHQTLTRDFYDLETAHWPEGWYGVYLSSGEKVEVYTVVIVHR
ncbi:MAG: PKD domain-containing protein, partial [Bacteroidota bacterium]